MAKSAKSYKTCPKCKSHASKIVHLCDADEMTDEQALIEANAKLLMRGDDSEVVCHEHGVTKRWGDLSSIAQLAVLAGIDVHGDRCIMED